MPLNVVLFIALYELLPFEQNQKLGLCLMAFIGVLWISEAIHVSLTALLVPVLAVFLGLEDTKDAFRAFADPIIFLFFGGFALACALHIQGLDKFIAQKMIILAKGKMSLAICFLFLVTAVLSMWISNTATAAIMLPLGLGILSNISQKTHRSTYTFVLLGIAYSASIGGFGTIVGSPPNALAASYLGIDFLGWMKLGIPLVMLMLPSCIFILYLVTKPSFNDSFDMDLKPVEWDNQKTITIVIFLAMAFAWIFSSKISAFFGGIKEIDSLIAILGAIAIGGSGVASWREIQRRTDWGVLWLFGGGLALGGIIESSGASEVMAKSVGSFGSESWLLIIIVLTLFVIALTEFTSNTASASLLIPIFASVSAQFGMSENILTLVIAFAASCAFMLPVATPPNAIVYGTGYVKQSEMIKSGIWLGIFSVFVISFFARYIW